MSKKVIHLINGDIHIHPDFFEDNLYKQIIKKASSIKTKPTSQPQRKTYGNRMQAMPCHEALFNFKKDVIISKFEDLLGVKIINYECLYRKIKTAELKKSQCNARYGFIHKDTETFVEESRISQYRLAGVMHFDQSYEGGTAFFEHYWDKVPDIYIGAYPNRLLLYNSNRWHCPSFDFSYKERDSLAFFLTVKI